MICAPFSWIFTASANRLPKSKPTVFITMMAMKLAPDSSRTALMICTQVVASMPPNSTYMTISTPTSTTAT